MSRRPFPVAPRRFGRRQPTWVLIVVAALYLATEYLPRVWHRGEPIEQAIAARSAGTWVTGSGKVAKVLPDDSEGDRHQRFLLQLPSRRTVLVAHNLDVGTRAPVRAGGRVTVHGEYVWNDKGGVLHWTHRDPSGRRPGGWIEFDGQRYE